MEITKAFSLRINELIDETGLSLENLSRAAGVSVFTLFHLKGQNNPKLPSTKVLLNLADYFKCSLSFMLGQEECNSLPSPKTELPAFSDRLRELIEAKELKFFLMKKSGLKKDFPSMYNWLSGKYIPNVYNLVRLANVRVQKGNYKKVITSKQPIQCNVKQKPSYVASDGFYNSV